jgi:integrase
MFSRQGYQQGSLRKVKRKRGPAVWEFRYRDNSVQGRPQRQITLSTVDFPTEAAVWRHLEALVWKLNTDSPKNATKQPTFGALCDLFIADEQLEEIANLKSGEANTIGELRVSTARGYLQIINGHIRPEWGGRTLDNVKPSAVADWLKRMQCSALTKAHIKAVMSRLFKKAMLWDLMNVQVNPMSLVEVRGVSKRKKRPLLLTLDQSVQVRESMPEPYRTMVVVAQCTGLRVSEILALKWGDVDFERLSMRVSRAVVRGVVDEVKTEYSEDDLPLDPDFATELLNWKRQCPPSKDGWMFPSPVTARPYEPGTIQYNYIREAGKKLGLHGVGWHTFRHTYRSLLDASGAPVGVQQKLMRHAQVSTTMDIYGGALMEAKRDANSKVARMVLKGE